MMNDARDTGVKEFDLSEIGDSNLLVLESELHDEMVEGFIKSAEEIELVLYLSLVLYLLPIAIFNKYVFARITGTHFTFTSAQGLDFISVGIVTMIWVVSTDYNESDLKYPLFNDEEDS